MRTVEKKMMKMMKMKMKMNMDTEYAHRRAKPRLLS